MALCVAWNVRAIDEVPPCNAFGAAKGNAYSISIEYSELVAACTELINKFVTGVPDAMLVFVPSAVLNVVPLIMSAPPFTETLNCNPVDVDVNKLGDPPFTTASTANQAPAVPVYFTLYEHFANESDPLPNPAEESPGIIVVTAQVTLDGVPASTVTVPAANVSAEADIAELNNAFVAPIAIVPAPAIASATATSEAKRCNRFLFMLFPLL